jgi:probable HAF family extracellular repeat protein
MLRNHNLTIAILVSCALASQAGADDVRYTITDLGVLDGPSSYAVAMNDLGQVAGYADICTRYTQAFLYTGSGPLIKLGSFGGDYSVSCAQAVNNQGMVVGYSDTSPGGGPEHAFVYTQIGGMKDLGTLGGTVSEALDINNSGQIVGFARTADGVPHGFIYSGNGPMIDLGVNKAVLINDAGLVVAVNGPAFYLHTYVSSGGTGTWTDIGSLGGTETAPYGMNNLGEIVGLSTPSADTNFARAFAYKDGMFTDLGTLGGTTSVAVGVNDAGVVVGGAYLAGDVVAHAFVDYGSGSIEDLNSLIDPTQGWTLVGGTAVNDGGQIAAWGYQTYGVTHALLLTPVPTPEPSTVWLLALAAIVLAGIQARRHFKRTSSVR